MSNTSLARSTRFGAAVTPGTLTIPAVAGADVNGNLMHTSDAGDGTSFLGGSGTLLALPSAAYTSSVPAAATFSTTWVKYATLDITLTSFTGGSSPTITFIHERQGADGVWYQILSTGALNSAPQTISVDISPSLNGSVTGPLSSTIQHNVYTHSARLRWTFGGVGSPTAVTFSASIVGRS